MAFAKQVVGASLSASEANKAGADFYLAKILDELAAGTQRACIFRDMGLPPMLKIYLGLIEGRFNR
jgi:hypothetical protein